MSRSEVRPSSSPARLRRITRRGSLALLAGAGAVALLAGCGAGQISETAKIKPAVQGANATSADGTIALRDLTVAFRGDANRTYAKGENAPLVVRIANAGENNDTLTSVDTTDAQSVVYVNNASSPSPSGSPKGSPSPSPANQPPGPDRFQIGVPTQGLVDLIPDQGQFLELFNVNHPLNPGESVTLVFHFQKAGAVPIDVPVALPDQVTERSAQPHVGSGE
ncbi:hypothetical protein [Actinocatenispora rupis]|uniref:Copper(I)-binding protein n=1 Tax=Actinocatenispora rupis TaxID=519421 RepID=A0A8J3JCK1_9ACTN|nr:hypothetical protein [Actinocatenispora rupis]GID15962.1 hypothetical protein Aru02nite_68510 [Actinocatenispora rupis]